MRDFVAAAAAVIACIGVPSAAIGQTSKPQDAWTYRETSGGSAASLTSQDGRSRLVVRCDRQDVPVLSIQYIPSKGLGYSAATPKLAIDGSPFNRFSLAWENAPQGAYFADNGNFDFSGTAFAAYLSAVDNVRVTIEAKGASGAPVVQSFVSPGDKDAVIRRVASQCDRDFENANPLLRGWEEGRTTVDGQPAFLAKLRSVEGRNQLEFRCSYADNMDVSLRLSGSGLDRQWAFEVEDEALQLPWTADGGTRVLRDDPRIYRLARLLLGDDPPLLGISVKETGYKSAFFPPMDQSRSALIAAFEMCNIPIR